VNLDWHTGTMESVGEQHPLARQSLVTRTELDLGDRKRVSQMKRAIHIGVWEVPEPLGAFLLDLYGGQSSQVIWGGGVGVKTFSSSHFFWYRFSRSIR